MKTSIATLFAVSTLTASIALAENNASQAIGAYGEFDYTYQYGHDSSDQTTNGFGLKFGYSPTRWLDLDLSSTFTMMDFQGERGLLTFDNYDLTTQTLEAGVRGSYGITDTYGVYSRATLGQMWVSDLDDFTYGSIEPGVYWKPFGEQASTRFDLGYRYRDSFESSGVNFESNSLVIGGEYEVIPGSSVTGQYEYVSTDRDDSDYSAFTVGYRHRF
jgi:hypothetical protein